MLIQIVSDRNPLRAFRTAVVGFGLSTGLFAAMVSTASAETLRIAVPSDPGYIDPAYWGSTVDQFLIDNLYPRLAKYVPDRKEWKIALDAAKSVDLSDPMNIAFELKPGIMWTGGYGELTAEDVKYSFERHLDPDLASGVAIEFSKLKSVEVTGKYTGVIHMSEPSPTFWAATLVSTSGAIVSKKAAEKAGGWFEATPTAVTGPYELKSFEPGSKLVLERNPDWKGETGDFDEIDLLPIADENAAELAFSAGEIDYFRDGGGRYDTLKADPPKDGEIALAQSIDPTWLGLTISNPKLQDIRIRKAIQLAIDVPSIIQATLGSAGKQATGFVAEGLPGYRDGNAIKRDVDKARALMAAAGSEGLTLRLDYVNKTERSTVAQIIQANLAEIGITVELNPQDEGTFWSLDDARAADLQLHLKEWSGNPEAFYMLQYFVEDQIGSWNWEAYHSPEYDALVEEARGTADPEKRAELYKAMQDMLEDSGAFVFLSLDPRVIVNRKDIVPGILPDGRPVFAAFKKAG